MEIYNGIRGVPFVNFLKSIFALSSLKQKSYEQLLSNQAVLTEYNKVFTHKTFDTDNNYEYYELQGDVLVNKCILNYLGKKYPILRNSSGVVVLTRMKINVISKRSLASMAKKFHFWEFINMNMETKNKKMDKVLEDVFEAFFGYTEMMIDAECHHGLGNIICESIIHSMLREMKIPTKYEELYDAKTRLKEIFDLHKNIGRHQYEHKRDNDIYYVESVLRTNNQERIVMGYGRASLKADAEQRASEESIRYLKKKGYTKQVPEIFKKLEEYIKTNNIV